MTSSCPQVLSLQHSGSDSSHAQFAAYWKPVLSMDANSWQRWLHMHRLVLILEHDTWVSLVGPQPGWRSTTLAHPALERSVPGLQRGGVPTGHGGHQAEPRPGTALPSRPPSASAFAMGRPWRGQAPWARV